MQVAVNEHIDWETGTGRPAIARQKTNKVQQLRKQGLGASEIAKQLGIRRASVYRVSH